MSAIASVQLIIGLEVHVELCTRSKMFASAPSPAHRDSFERSKWPNTLVDSVVLGLPGSLPVINEWAVELSMRVGLALGCEIARETRWDRKSYFYPDLPKNYQISQLTHPICGSGEIRLPEVDAGGRVVFSSEPAALQVAKTIRITRAHLEEDAGKLLHEAPMDAGLEESHFDGTGVDFNRAGTPLLEIVTEPDFRSADEVVIFCKYLREICRWVGATEGIMQRGHMRFEPNINCLLTLADGRTVRTPIVEVKNLNSFKSVRAAILHELDQQPKRWLTDGKVHRPGGKTTRGWDDQREETFLQREKEEADDYRYFPDPDLLPIFIDESWIGRARQAVGLLPVSMGERLMREFGLSQQEAAMLVEERGDCELYLAGVKVCEEMGLPRERAARGVANLLLQSGAKRANERSTMERPTAIYGLGVTAQQIASLVAMRERGEISSQSADQLFGIICDTADGSTLDPADLAKVQGLLVVRDDGLLKDICQRVIAANPAVAQDVRSGKMQAIGRLIGEATKLASAAGKSIDAKNVREMLLKELGV